MEALSIPASVSSPFVEFDPDNGQLEIGGESYPENSYEFYLPILNWIDSFLEGTETDVLFTVSLSYLNTSSTKYMIDVLDRFEAAHLNGRHVRVKWYYDADNERARDTIEEFKEDFTMPFEVIPQEGLSE